VDPYLDNVFDGEEGSRGIRFFTHGYDVYTPDRVLVTHDYHTHQSNPVTHTWGRNKKPADAGNLRGSSTNSTTAALPPGVFEWNREIESLRPTVNVTGTRRVNMLLGIGDTSIDETRDAAEIDFVRKSRYGLGTRRTLEQAIEFTGINLKERKMETNRCGNLIWVPFEENEQFGLYETLSRPIATESVVSNLPRREESVGNIDGRVENPVTSSAEQASQHIPPPKTSHERADHPNGAIPLSHHQQPGAPAPSSLSTAFLVSFSLFAVVGIVGVRLARKQRKDDRHKN